MIATGQAVMYTATRLPAAKVKRLLAAGTARSDADGILAQARAEAEALVQAAHAEAAALRAAAREQADTLRATLAEETAQALAAREMAEGLHAARRIEARFDALSPWIETLVQTAVTRIVGTLPADARHGRIIDEALAKARPAGKLRLRAHPDDLTAVASAIEGLGLGAIVAADPMLDPGALILDSDAGLFDLSLTAQVDLVLADLSRALADEATQ